MALYETRLRSHKASRRPELASDVAKADRTAVLRVGEWRPKRSRRARPARDSRHVVDCNSKLVPVHEKRRKAELQYRRDRRERRTPRAVAGFERFGPRDTYGFDPPSLSDLATSQRSARPSTT